MNITSMKKKMQKMSKKLTKYWEIVKQVCETSDVMGKNEIDSLLHDAAAVTTCSTRLQRFLNDKSKELHYKEVGKN